MPVESPGINSKSTDAFPRTGRLLTKAQKDKIVDRNRDEFLKDFTLGVLSSILREKNLDQLGKNAISIIRRIDSGLGLYASFATVSSEVGFNIEKSNTSPEDCGKAEFFLIDRSCNMFTKLLEAKDLNGTALTIIERFKNAKKKDGGKFTNEELVGWYRTTLIKHFSSKEDVGRTTEKPKIREGYTLGPDGKKVIRKGVKEVLLYVRNHPNNNILELAKALGKSSKIIEFYMNNFELNKDGDAVPKEKIEKETR